MAGAHSEVLVHRDAQHLARGAAALIAGHLRAVVARRRQASLVLSGGSTPLATYRLLAREDLPWDRIELYWGDERCVPADDPESNFASARHALIEPAGIPDQVVHRLRGELGPESSAADYEELLRSKFQGPQPAFDLVLLGVGADGHTASLFPESQIGASGSWVIPTWAPQPPHERVSLSYEALGGAKRTVFLVSGQQKAAVMGRILSRASPDLPAARVAERADRVSWLLDRRATSHSSGPSTA